MTKQEMTSKIIVLEKRIGRLEKSSLEREDKLAKIVLMMDVFMPAIEHYCADELNSILERIHSSE
jgi:predicted phosphohydrolase